MCHGDRAIQLAIGVNRCTATTVDRSKRATFGTGEMVGRKIDWTLIVSVALALMVISYAIALHFSHKTFDHNGWVEYPITFTDGETL